LKPAAVILPMCIAVLATAPQTSPAATVVTSNPGAVTVMGGPEPNLITVEDSLHERNVAPVRLGAMLAARPLVQDILIRVESIVLEGGPPTAGRIALAAVGFLTVTLNAEELDNDLEADGALIITDDSGTPIKTAPPCRHVLRNQNDLNTRLVNSVKCSLLPGSSDVVPSLMVMAGGGDDRVLLALSCQPCLRDRIVAGEQDNDTLWGSVFADQIDGNTGSDFVRGRDGEDALAGGAGNDLLFGGADSDTIAGSLGNDLVSGGPGNDVTTMTPEGVALSGGAGDDIVVGGRGVDTMSGTLGRDTLLSRETDFGTQDEFDPVVNCGADGPEDKFVRYSPGGGGLPPDKLFDCPDTQHPTQIGSLLLRSLSPNNAWPWLPLP